MQEQDGKHCTLLCTAERERALADPRLQRTENPELDRSRIDEPSRDL